MLQKWCIKLKLATFYFRNVLPPTLSFILLSYKDRIYHSFPQHIIILLNLTHKNGTVGKNVMQCNVLMSLNVNYCDSWSNLYLTSHVHSWKSLSLSDEQVISFIMTLDHHNITSFNTDNTFGIISVCRSLFALCLLSVAYVAVKIKKDYILSMISVSERRSVFRIVGVK